MATETDFVLPSEFNNTVMLVVTVFTLLWAMKVTKEVYYMLRIRSAVVTNRVIQIRGLSSYLSYFETASQSHVNAIVHTRQTKPPLSMNIAYVPFSVLNLVLVKNSPFSYDLECNITTSVNCKVLALFSFNSVAFRTMATNFRKLNAKHVHEDGSAQVVFLENMLQIGSLHTSAQGLYDTPVNTSSSSNSNNGGFGQLPLSSVPLTGSESCQFECLARDAAPGSHRLVFTLTEDMGTMLESHSAGRMKQPQQPEDPGDGEDSTPEVDPATALSIAIFMIPNVPRGGIAAAQSIVSSSGSSRKNSASALSPLHITRSVTAAAATPPPATTTADQSHAVLQTKPTAVTNLSSSSSSPSKSQSLFELPSSFRASKKSGSRGRASVNPDPTEATSATAVDIESGVYITKDGGDGNMRGSSASEDRDSGVTSPVDSLLGSSGTDSRKKSSNRSGGKKSNTNTVQTTAPVCSGVYVFSLPHTALGFKTVDNSSNSSSNGNNGSNGKINHVRKSAKVSPSTSTKGGGDHSHNQNHNENSMHEETVFSSAHLLNNPTRAAVSMQPAELMVIDPMCYLYNSQEIFGLGPAASTATASNKTAATATAPDAPSTAGALFSSGGRYVEEDCVVCLSEPKEIALLPCRHLCVCQSCLIYIDKCPVCRAAFEEYVVIQSKDILSIEAPTTD